MNYSFGVADWPQHRAGQLRRNDEKDVMINGKLIEHVQHAKLLGVTLDCHHGRNTLITYGHCKQ